MMQLKIFDEMETKPLKENRVYLVKLGGAEIRSGIYLGINKSGYNEVLVHFGKKDVVKMLRKYSFHNYSVDGNKLNIPSPKGPSILSENRIRKLNGLIKKLGEKQ